jgi:hypothetical protein
MKNLRKERVGKLEFLKARKERLDELFFLKLLIKSRDKSNIITVSA